MLKLLTVIRGFLGVLFLLLGYAGCAGVMVPESQVSPPIPTPITLELNCLESINRQNINQIRMLEEYEPLDGSSSIQFSPDGSLIAFSGSNGVSILDFRAQHRTYFRQLQSRRTYGERDVDVASFEFSPDNRLVMTYAWNGQSTGGLKIWDVKSASLLHVIENDKAVFDVAISSDSRFLAFVMETGTYRIDMQQEQWQRELISEQKEYSSEIIFNPLNSEELLGGTSKGLMTFNSHQTMPGETTSVITSVSINANIMFGYYSDVEISPDGIRLFKRDYRENILEIWNLKTGEREVLIPSIKEMGIAIVDWERDLLAYSSGYDIIIVNIVSGEKTIQLVGHERLVYDISFHPTEPLLVSSSNDATVRIWNYETGQDIKSFPLEYSSLFSAEFNSQGTLLAFIKKSNLQVWGYKNCS